MLHKIRTFRLTWSFEILGDYRSSRPDVFCKKGALRNFAKFTRKHLCQSLFFTKETLVQVCSCEFCEISKNTFFTEHLLTTASKTRKYQKIKNFKKIFLMKWKTTNIWLLLLKGFGSVVFITFAQLRKVLACNLQQLQLRW